LGENISAINDGQEYSTQDTLDNKNKDPLPSRFFRYNKQQEQRRKAVSVDRMIAINTALQESTNQTKKTYVSGIDYNEEFGLLAIAMIDHEVKIYYLKQNGSVVRLLEHTSFFCKKHIITKVHFGRYVANRKIILCCGTYEGLIYIYEIEWDEKDPHYAKNAHLNNPKDYRYHRLVLKPFDFMCKEPKLHKDKKQEQQQDEKRSLLSSPTRIIESPRDTEEESPAKYKSPVIDQSSAVKSHLMNPNLLLKDDYWNIIANARDKKEGPDGIAIFNAVHKEFNNKKSDLYQGSNDFLDK
jgi:hypothetical protein